MKMPPNFYRAPLSCGEPLTAETAAASLSSTTLSDDVVGVRGGEEGEESPQTPENKD
jgi:hypothetical protein